MTIREIIGLIKEKIGVWRAELPSASKFFGNGFGGGRESVSGLRVTPGAVEWAVLRGAKNGFETLSSGRVELSAAGDDAERVKNRDEALKNNCTAINGQVAVGIATDKMLMRVADLPTTDPAEIMNMVQLQVDAFSPFPEERIYVSHEVLSSGNGNTRVVIAAAQKELIESTGAFLKAAGLDVQRFDSEALVWWHLLSRAAAPHTVVPREGRHLLLILEPWGGVWIVVQDNEPLAFRSVHAAGSMPADEYARELAADASSLMLAMDMERGSLPLSDVVIWQRGVELGEITKELKAELLHEIRVESLDVLPSLSEGLAQRFTGTALSSSSRRVRSGQPVLDLVPEAWHSAVLAGNLRARLILASVGVLALWLLGMTAFVVGYQIQKYRVSKLDARMKLLEEPEKEVTAMQTRVRTFEQYLDRRNSALECLREVTSALPGNVLLKTFQFRKGRNVMIRGEALSPEPIYDYKKALDKVPLFTNVELGSIQPGKRKDTNIQTFQMNAKLREQP